MAYNGANEVVIVSHSNVVYWWPAWVVGYIMAGLSYIGGTASTVPIETVAYVHPSNNPGSVPPQCCETLLSTDLSAAGTA